MWVDLVSTALRPEKSTRKLLGKKQRAFIPLSSKVDLSIICKKFGECNLANLDGSVSLNLTDVFEYNGTYRGMQSILTNVPAT
jgi:hypothetical protein